MDTGGQNEFPLEGVWAQPYGRGEELRHPEGVRSRTAAPWPQKERSGVSQEGLESVAGEKEGWNTLLRSLPPRPDLLINGGKWTDGHSANWTSWPA